MTDPARLTADELAELTEYHVYTEGTPDYPKDPQCECDEEPWPCTVIRLLAQNRALAERVAALETAHQEACSCLLIANRTVWCWFGKALAAAREPQTPCPRIGGCLKEMVSPDTECCCDDGTCDAAREPQGDADGR